MKILKPENVLYVLIVMILIIALYVEFIFKRDMYMQEKIGDLTLQYKSKLLFNEKIIDTLLNDILVDSNLMQIMYEASNGIDKDVNRKNLLELFHSKYEDFTKRGIHQFHFHLADGESFLRFHKPEANGDSLLFRESIKKVIRTQQKVFGFEVSTYFEGYRYVYPLFFEDNYVGSVEASIKTSSIFEQMKEILHARYNLILKSQFLDGTLIEEQKNKFYRKFSVDDRYYVSKDRHTNSGLIKDSLLENKINIKHKLKKNQPFVQFIHDENNHLNTLVFIPVRDFKAETIGYFFSLKNDETIHTFALIQLYKFIAAWILFSLIFYFYITNKKKANTIKQLLHAIDQTTLLSKTDPKGKITYVNEAFENLSGYTRDELVGKPHSIVREPSVPKEIFRDMWQTIQAQKIWHGIITNKAKDGSNYIVDASIIPIVNINGKIKEYIAIRHDVTELEKYKAILKEQLDDTSKSLEENINYTQQYEDAINGSTAVIKTDTDNRLIYVNDRFCQLGGYTREDLIGTDIQKLHHENHALMGDCERIAEQMHHKKTVSIVFTTLAKNGTLLFLDTLVYPIVDRDGKVIEHLHLMHDISEIVNLHQELEDTQKEIIYKMGEIGETRSKETGNHVKRVAEYSKLLALLYGIDEKEAEMLKLASPMHDIGKVGIPDNILKKPGKLTQDEWQVMQSHAELGFEMLKHSNRPILKAAATVAAEHHEKWDGSGYPKGLKGEEIHIFGRITAIADVFDALGSDRCYKKAWELERILRLFEEEKGKHFDPKLVELFFENLDSFLKIRDRFTD